ncbi:AmmeMemoRadiSam system radical SAM enzyme [candidate division WOR-3 bacterium]|nr:AmmeMemoRadiSam system radical SAM enzyme [candidate division WOR-3 bacterium]
MGEMNESVLQESGKCLVCERQCKIDEDSKGHCGTRINRQGTIYTLNYGNISSLSINQIEKKPFFHYYPGSRALTVGFWSCNFDCPWCQNHDISKVEPQSKGYISPEEFVRIALANSCQGTSLSFNEPTLFLEWGIETFEIAKRRDLYNTIVTNGYMTERALELLIHSGLDAANVDIKGSISNIQKYCHADGEKIWRNCKMLKDSGVHLEVTTLMITGVNDDLAVVSDIGKRILDDLGNIPWHLTRYFPAYEYSAPSTSVRFLEDAYQIAKGLGFYFVYLGNVADHKYENTSCPECGALLIIRSGLVLIDNKITGGSTCPHCGYDLWGYFIL